MKKGAKREQKGRQKAAKGRQKGAKKANREQPYYLQR
jgi:hypothetical protein